MTEGQTDTWPCPDWYPLMQAAKYLQIPVSHILDVPRYWIDRALIAMTAEAQAQEIKNKQQQS